MTFDKVKEILVAQLSLEDTEITESTSFDDLGLDSLDVVELLMAMEDEFGIEIKAEEAGKTIGDLVKYIDENK